MIDSELIRNFKISSDNFNLFLGAGASISSGIPTGQDLVWFFKREIYCTNQNIKRDGLKDLNAECVRKKLQYYFDNNTEYQLENKDKEYSFYFEKCYSNKETRQKFINDLMDGRKPSLGYLCLASLIVNNRIRNIFTTNFDNLIASALHLIDPNYSINEYSSSNISNCISSNNNASIFKLHGDYRYDYLKNTEKELQEFEESIYKSFYKQLLNKGLIVIGYSGLDESVMSFFEDNVSIPNFLSHGLYWFILKGSKINDRVNKLLCSLHSKGIETEIIECESFDDIMLKLYRAFENKNDLIENSIDKSLINNELKFNCNRNTNFIKLNAYECVNVIPCKVFDTDIMSWEELKKITKNKIPSALYKSKIYCFASIKEIKVIFSNHIKGNIEEITFDELCKRHAYNTYLDLVYDLIKLNMQDKGYISYNKNHYYDANDYYSKDDNCVYNAVEFKLEYLDEKIFLIILPTKHILINTYKELETKEYKIEVNNEISGIYNVQYSDLLNKWQNIFKATLNGTSYIQLNSWMDSILFNLPAVCCNSNKANTKWIEKDAYRIDEPYMKFSFEDSSKISANQILGLINFGPLETDINREEKQVRLAVLTPEFQANNILRHLSSLKEKTLKNTKSRDMFIQDFLGFKEIYDCNIIVPNRGTDLCKEYDYNCLWDSKPEEYVKFLKNKIDSLYMIASSFDVLIIYIPNKFEKFRENKQIYEDFNLHDEIKLYAMKRGIVVQFIEEHSLRFYDQCKVKWALATSLYTKGTKGLLWQPKDVEKDTAYIGISYAISKEQGICIGCSQLFDNAGNGMRMILKKVKNPRAVFKKNPYMSSEEARLMMSALKDDYYSSYPAEQLKRIVIHKNTPFVKDEIVGILQAFKGIEDVELIQIQDYSGWRGLRYKIQDGYIPDNFPQFRGTIVKLSKNKFLLWTHGSLINSELGYGNYYKGGRGIPMPLLITRYYGNCNAEILAKEIMMLTKMNFNSGDSLYKNYPVTIDFAKTIARMCKQKEKILDVAYDFRFFM